MSTLQRFAFLLLTMLSCTGAPAQGLDHAQLSAEADRAQQLMAAILREHGSGNEGCLKVAQALSQHRFGVHEVGRLQLLAGQEALDYQRRWRPRSLIVALTGACGWTHVAAYEHTMLYPAVVPPPEPLSATFPPGDADDASAWQLRAWRLRAWLLRAWPWLLGGLGVAVTVAIGGAALAMARARRAELAARETVIQVPVPSVANSHPLLDELLQERAKLINELRAAGIELSAQTGAPSGA